MRKKLSAQSNPSPAKSTAPVNCAHPQVTFLNYGYTDAQCDSCKATGSYNVNTGRFTPVAAMATNTPSYCAYCGKPIGSSFTSTGGQYWCGQGCYTGYQNIQQFDWTADEEVLPAYGPGPPRCSYCDRELSETLDRPALKTDREDHCRDCRTKLPTVPF